jgi:hypothetical protein
VAGDLVAGDLVADALAAGAWAAAGFGGAVVTALIRHAHTSAASASPAGIVTGATSRNVRTTVSTVRCGQPLEPSRTGSSVSARQPRADSAAIHTAVIGSVQPAWRPSRAAGQPRRQAMAYPAAVTMASGQTASAAAASSSQSASRNAWPSSRRAGL